ncbi:MerC family mercury resistance protein, partial [Chryseobacterium sp. SIMBA_038]
HNPYVDLAFLVIGALVVFRITRHMANRWLAVLFWASILMISISVFTDLLFEIHLPLIYVGAVGLIAGHIINFKNHKH